MTKNNYITNMARSTLKNRDRTTVHELSEIIRYKDERKNHPRLIDENIIELIYRNLEYIAVNEICFSSNQFVRRHNYD